MKLHQAMMMVTTLFILELPAAATSPQHETNSLGMELVAIEPGSYTRGSSDGKFDERPEHQVTITRPFRMGVTPVTNEQFEQFDPSHREYRVRHGISKGDKEAVVNVTWEQATSFCKWLSEKENRPYRLPTEAEWEYAARAGTTTPYFMGSKLAPEFHKEQNEHWVPVEVDLTAGQTPANPWGLRDVHGIVEEWCADWYGPYPEKSAVDPVGPARGDFRVTRGGSHSTPPQYLRSAARFATLPEDRHWLIGFRVVQAELPPAGSTPPIQPQPLWARDVSQSRYDWQQSPDHSQPLFAGPIEFVKIAPGSTGPLFSQHNHCPAITACPNGDLLAIWYSTTSETAREHGLAASRLRRGTTQWEPAEPFWDAPGRNDHGEALWWDSDETLYHFNGLGAADTWGMLALVLRTSTDNGATWSKGRLINREHGLRNMPISNVIKTRDGKMLLTCDAATGGSGGSAVHISDDRGQTWRDPGRDKPAPKFHEGETGAWIAGIHASLVERTDGSLLALGRGNDLNGEMPRSISRDGGETWTYSPSGLPPVHGGQRIALLRLQEGPLLLFSFTNHRKTKGEAAGMTFQNTLGENFTGIGMYAALSFDDGETWPVQKLMTDGGPGRELDGGAWTRGFVMDATHAEPAGYLDAIQSPDGVIHLISSKLHYQLNLAWLRTPNTVSVESILPEDGEKEANSKTRQSLTSEATP
jgi:formylglycine-generating enzyme